MSHLGFAAFVFSSCSIAAAALVSPVVLAQAAPPSGLLKKEHVTSGKTEVVSEGFEGVGKAPPPEEELNATDLQIGAGAFFAAGNSQSVAATLSAQFRLRREAHQLSLLAGANYGAATAAKDPNAPPGTPEPGLEDTVRNFQGRARYDYFLSKSFALFLGVSARNDKFQGLDLRLNVAPGAAYYAIDEKEQRLWGELGYSLQHDIRSDDAVKEARVTEPEFEDTATRHYGRLFLGYSNALNENVALNLGIEYLLAISPWEDELTKRKNMRLGAAAALNTKISDRFSVATAFTLDYDSNPVPGVKKVDATTSVNLVCTLL